MFFSYSLPYIDCSGAMAKILPSLFILVATVFPRRFCGFATVDPSDTLSCDTGISYGCHNKSPGLLLAAISDLASLQVIPSVLGFTVAAV